MPRWHQASAFMRESARTRLWLSGYSGVAYCLVLVDVQPAGHMRQQLGQRHGVPGAAASPHLVEAAHAPFVGLQRDTIIQPRCCSSYRSRSSPGNCDLSLRTCLGAMQREVSHHVEEMPPELPLVRGACAMIIGAVTLIPGRCLDSFSIDGMRGNPSRHGDHRRAN